MPIRSCRPRRRLSRRGHAGYRLEGGLFRLAVLVELRDVGPEIVRLILVLDAGEHHLGTGDLALWVLDVVEELVLAPGDAGILVGIRIVVAFDRAGLTAVEEVRHRADLVVGAFADGVAGQALVERSLSRV